MKRIVRCMVGVCFVWFGVAHAHDDNVRVEQLLTIPENCAVWFDGCNTCEVGAYNAETKQYKLVCTEMLCPPEMLETPKCIEYREDEHYV